MTTTLTSADDLIGRYGVGTTEYDDETGEAFTVYREGLLTEHAEQFLAAGGRIAPRSTNNGGWAILSDGRAVPVVCSEIIGIVTEDGPATGRCGLDAADADPGMCYGHGAEYRRYMADLAVADARRGDPSHDEYVGDVD